MRYCLFVIFTLLTCVSCFVPTVAFAMGEVVGGGELELLRERFPLYVASLPRPVRDVEDMPFRWVGLIHGQEPSKSCPEVRRYCTGCLFEHPQVVLTAAHNFFTQDKGKCNFEYSFLLKSHQLQVPLKMDTAVKIRKVIINNGSNGFLKLFRSDESLVFFDEDIACAILYEPIKVKPGDFATAYKPDVVTNAATSRRSKMSACYFRSENMYAAEYLGDNACVGLMRMNVPTKRRYLKVPYCKYVYSTEGGYFPELQIADSEPLVVMTKGCSGAPIFVQDDDESWKVAMIHLGVIPNDAEELKTQMDGFLNGIKVPDAVNCLRAYGRIVDQTFYDNIWTEVMSILGNPGYNSISVFEEYRFTVEVEDNS